MSWHYLRSLSVFSGCEQSLAARPPSGPSPQTSQVSLLLKLYSGTDDNSHRCEVAEGQMARAERSERSAAHAPQRCARAAAVGSAAIWPGSVDVGCEPRGIRRAMEPGAAWTRSSGLI